MEVDRRVLQQTDKATMSAIVRFSCPVRPVSVYTCRADALSHLLYRRLVKGAIKPLLAEDKATILVTTSNVGYSHALETLVEWSDRRLDYALFYLSDPAGTGLTWDDALVLGRQHGFPRKLWAGVWNNVPGTRSSLVNFLRKCAITGLLRGIPAYVDAMPDATAAAADASAT